jgi:hypothetical protein
MEDARILAMKMRDGDDGARAERRPLLLLISHLMDVDMQGRMERVTVGKLRTR